MIDHNNDAQNIIKADTKQPHTKQMQVRMQQGEHSGQPIYSNFVSAQGGQGVIIVDFGFLDPKTINALNQIAKAGEKMPDTIDARMSCRMAISIDTANQLAQQLNQLLGARNQAEKQQKNVSKETTASSDVTSVEETTPESSQGGFKLPWSK